MDGVTAALAREEGAGAGQDRSARRLAFLFLTPIGVVYRDMGAGGI